MQIRRAKPGRGQVSNIDSQETSNALESSPCPARYASNSPGALYHVTSRGDRREDIFFDDTDRAALLDVMAQGMARFDAQVLAYCLMGNHYHLVLHTPKPGRLE